MNLDLLKKEEESLKLLKNNMDKNSKNILYDLEKIKEFIYSTELNSKLNLFEEQYQNEILNLLQSIESITSYMTNQLEKYVIINETTKIDLSDLIQTLDSIENPFKNLLKGENNYE